MTKSRRYSSRWQWFWNMWQAFFGRRAAALPFRPLLERLEDRTVPSANGFIQGTAFLNTGGATAPTTPNSYLQGVTIELFKQDPVSKQFSYQTSTQTGSDGSYLFSGLTPGTYQVEEIAPTGYAATGTNILSDINPASSVNNNTIQVTVVDPTTLSINFNSGTVGGNPNLNLFYNRNLWDWLGYDLNGNAQTNTAGQFPITVTGTNPTTNQTFTTSTFLALCWDLNHTLNNGTNVYSVTGIPSSSPNGAPPNAGEIAYLFNHYGALDIGGLNDTNGQNAATVSADANAAAQAYATAHGQSYTPLAVDARAEAVGLQLAIWQLEYGGNFNNLSALAPFTTQAQLNAAESYASAFIDDAAGKSETATFLQVPSGASPTGRQGLIATGSYDFGNIGQPSITTTPSSTTVALGTSGVTLKDTAQLTGGYSPGGTITFNLVGPNGQTVDKEQVTVSGDGSYSTPNGYTLPTTAAVTGLYQWNASYSGDTNNNTASDIGDTKEQVTVSAASPTVVTTASPNTTLPINPTGTVTLSDSAVLSGGYAPGGSLVFTLTGPNGYSYTQTDKVSSNGTYTASTTLPTSGAVAGTYTWSVTYTGDSNNNSYTETGSASNGEQTIVSAASPTVVTTASPNTTLPTNPTGTVTLSDSAVLSGGYAPGGNLVFTLTGPGGFTYTQTDKVSGNGTYTASTVLPTTGAVAGTYTWSATYTGDSNNNSYTETGSASNGEQTVVSAASPTVVTTASSNTTLSNSTTTLSDSAVLSGGYAPGGNLIFTLTGPNGYSYTQTDKVSGNGTYTASTTLPTTGVVAGTYTWSATYTGDSNNNSYTETGSASNGEQTVAGAASPTITTTASPNTTLPINPTGTVTLSDSAVLSGGYAPGGNLLFTLTGPNGYSYTQTDAVNGNGTYTASTVLPTTGAVAGTYTWSAFYAGDSNNNSFTETGSAANGEQTIVSAASPTVVTTASPNTTLPINPTGTVPLSDSAVLSGGYAPGGNLLFTLTGPNGYSYTQTDAVNGNGTYTASTVLPTTGAVAGTYTWSATYTGDSNNNSYTETGSASNGEQTVVSAASPSISTTPSQTSVTLGTSPVTLYDTAQLSGGYSPMGSITFTLYHNGNLVDTETATVNGNGSYTTPTGYTLPMGTTAVGSYQWNATYFGDSNNNRVSDNNDTTEQVSVSPASPSITTTPSQTSVTLGTSTVTLNDTAQLSGGYNPGGTITFTLVGPGNTVVDTETATVSGDGSYTTPTGYTLPTGMAVTGLYQWNATYTGDGNNSTASDIGDKTEQVNVSPATPTISTTPSTTSVTLSSATPPVLQDTAQLSGGYNPSGTITFTLVGPNGQTVDTETVTTNGNGSYTTPSGYTLPTNGSSVLGTYQWNAVYTSLYGNNQTASDLNDTAEQVTIYAASPTITTTAAQTLGNVVGTSQLSDTATLSGAYNPSGVIIFSLIAPDGSVAATEADVVNGNGTYSAAPVTATQAGIYTWHANYIGDNNNNLAVDNSGVNETSTVIKTSPTVVTNASQTSGNVVGTSVLSDSATITGTYNPSGTITFTLTGPNNATVYTETQAITKDGTYTTTGTGNGSDLATQVGTYTWSASYSGDSLNLAAQDNGTNESLTTVQASPTVATTASETAGGVVGTSVLSDSATVSGGYNPTGTITFTLTAPDGTTTQVGSSVTVNGDGTYTAPTVAATEVGTYSWHASYSGDSLNNGAIDNGVGESVTTIQASPAVSTQASESAGGVVGTTVLSDLATITGGDSPTGTITFTLTAPDGTTSKVGSVTVNGDGIYAAPTVAATEVGNYTWHASYSGDTLNNGAIDNGVGESVTTVQASPAVSTTATETAGGVVGTSVLSDSATISGGYNPTGTITFTLTAPDGTTTQIGKSVTVNGDGTYSAPTMIATEVGTYTWHATYSGDSNNSGASDNGTNESLTTIQASPAVSTQATETAGGVVGTSVLSDSATLTGGYNPTGTITFTLTAPDGTTTQVGSVKVNGNATYTAPTVAATEVGKYTWHATYSGDSNNSGASDNGSNESLTTVQASPAVSTQATETAGGLVGTAVLSDSATLTGGDSPTGSITFTLTAPDGTTSKVGSVTVNGDGTYNAPTVTATEVGKYTWHATYSGDSNNSGASDNGVNESLTTIQASPAVNTQASETAGGLVGTAVLSDSATLTGGYNPTGTITFTLTAPDGTTTQVGSVKVNSNATYTAPTVTATEVGTYTWSASYSGDSLNLAAQDNGTNESLTTVQASPTVATTASETAGGVVGTSVLSDSATVSGGYNPTGTITFTLTAPDGTTTQVGSVTVNGDGIYSAPTVAATEVGTYSWHASYSGDTLNSSASDNGTNESLTTIKASPAVTTQASETAGGVGVSVLSDSATISGGYNPTGTITFTLTAPDGTTSKVGSVTVNGDGTYSAPNVTATEVGTYTWSAKYSGDSFNNSAIDNGSNESAGSSKATPTVSTQASETAGGVVGTTVLSDSATLTGGYNPTGSITFTLTAPDGTTSQVGSVTVNGNTTYTAPNVTATEVGKYTWHASYSGDSNNSSASDNGSNESLTTIQASPAVSTQATETASGVVGTSVLSDSATVSGGYNPTGTITFTLTAPDGTTSQVGSSVKVNGDGTYNAPTVTATEVGKYTWHATYSGDSNNSGASDNGANESLTTIQASPAVNTQATETAGGVVGTSVLSDSATLTGGDSPTGSITFTLTAPDGTTSKVGSVTVNGNGTYNAPTVTATEVGKYTWHASYSGDALNGSASDNGTNESLTTVQASPAVSTTASETAGGLVGTAVLSDSATLTGGYNPTGTITFTLTAPDGTTTQVGSSVKVNGDGTYTAPTVTATEVGKYTWHATYSGDSNNSSASDNGSNESLTTIQASPAVNTQATETAGGVVGTSVLSDSATLTGGYNPTGTITFTLTAPDGTTTQVGSVKVNGNATYTAPTVTATEVGKYTWHATYSGDSNNSGASDNGANESLTTIQASPTVATTASETAGGVVGTSVLSDSATISGGYNPTGTITFTLTAPDGTTSKVGSSVKVNGDGIYTAPNVTATEVGKYTWHASYSGDSLNSSASDNGANESVTTVKASPAVSTQASETAGGVVGTSVLSDSATITGGDSPTGTITFTLTGPGGYSSTQTVSVSGNGTYSTATPVLATQVGTYTWHASYTGDSLNNSAIDNGQNESLTTIKASPSISTTPGGTISLGSITISGTKYLDATGNGFSADDTAQSGVTMNLYQESNSSSGLQVGSGGDTLVASTTTASNGTYSFTVASPGTYYVQESVPSGYIQTGGGPNGSAGNTYYTVTAASGHSYSGYNFDDYQIPTCQPACVTYTVTTPSGCKTTGLTTLAGNTAQGDTVTATVTAGSMADTVTLVSYYAPGSSFSDSNAYQQQIYQEQTVTIAAGKTGTLTVQIPNTYYQIDLVCGQPINQLEPNQNNNAYGPDSASILYHAEGRYLSSDNGGTTAPSASQLNTSAPPVEAAPTTTTQVLTDSAQISGGYNTPGGSVTFYLFAPNVTPNGTYSNAVYSDQVTVNGDGTYTTASGSNAGGYVPTTAGTYEWVAVYSGDSNNNAVTSPFGSEAEVVSLPAQISVTKTADEAEVTAGQTAGYTVVITNNGTVTDTGVTLSDPLPAGTGSDINWQIDTSGTGLGAGTSPNDFQITGSTGNQSLSLSSYFTQTLGDKLAAGQSISVHITGVTTSNDAGGSINPVLGAAGNYAVLYEGTGGHNLQITNVTINGNIGVGGTGHVQFNGPGTIDGTLSFSAANTGQYANNNSSNVGPTSVNYNVAGVTTAISTVNNLSSSLTGLGTNLTINGTQTINESAGQLDVVNGATYRVFNVTSYSENDGKLLTINGDGSGDTVVFNFGSGIGNVNLGGDVQLTGGLSDDQVVWNFTSTGKNVQLNNNNSSYPQPAAFHGIILAPNDTISVVNASFDGRIFGGGCSDMQIVSGDNIQAPGVATTVVNTATVSAAGTALQQATATITVLPVGSSVSRGAAATIGFWHNKNGQTVIDSFNGSASATDLSNWLSSNFSNLYGTFAGQTNSQVASDYLTAFGNVGGVQGNTYAQTFAVALAVYATDPTLGADSTASSYGFVSRSGGTGSLSFNVGSNGAAFGVANNTSLDVIQILEILNKNYNATTGQFYGGNQSLTTQANNVTNGINQGGDIS